MKSKTKNIVKRGNTYYLRAMVNRKRLYRSLGTSNVKEAHRRGRDILKAARAGRFEVLESSKAKSAFARLGGIVDSYLAAAQVRGIRPRTAQDYVSSLYHIVSIGAGHPNPAEASTAILTRELVDVYVQARLNEANGDTVAVERARRSITSSLRQGRALFSKWALAAYYDLTLPDLGPFMTAGNIRVDQVIYRLPPDRLVRNTIHLGKTLRDVDNDLYAVFLLCYGLALRAGEAAASQWSWMRRGASGQVYFEIIKRDGFKPKGKERQIPVSAEVLEGLEFLMTIRQPHDHNWILPRSRPSARLNLVKRTFSQWMRGIGWKAEKYPKAAHELRKLMGSKWYTERGAEVAQAWLGHTNIATTCRFYAALTRQPAPVDL